MAGLQERGGSYRIIFRHHGKRHSLPVGKVDPSEAEAQVDYLLMRLKQRLVSLPDGCDIVTFLRNDGKLSDARPVLPEAKRKAAMLRCIRACSSYSCAADG